MKASITVGVGIDRAGVPMDPEDVDRLIGAAKYTAAKQFGGATIVRGEGVWVHPLTGETVSEPIVVFTVHGIPSRHDVGVLASVLRRLFNQESVVVEVTDPSVEFVAA